MTRLAGSMKSGLIPQAAAGVHAKGTSEAQQASSTGDGFKNTTCTKRVYACARGDARMRLQWVGEMQGKPGGKWRAVGRKYWVL